MTDLTVPDKEGNIHAIQNLFAKFRIAGISLPPLTKEDHRNKKGSGCLTSFSPFPRVSTLSLSVLRQSKRKAQKKLP